MAEDGTLVAARRVLLCRIAAAVTAFETGPTRMQGNPSKSARKRDQLALQALGEELIDLSPEELRRLPLDEDLRDAIVAAGGMTARGALRRQRQLIGKMMRRVDPQPIRRALESITRADRQAKRLFRQTEEWRDRILADGHGALDRFVAATGCRDDELRGCVDALPRCRNRSERRTLGRRIFRALHRELGARVHDDPS